MECDLFFFCQTAAAEPKCLALLKHPKAHATAAAAAAAERFIWMETLPKEITCKKTRAVAFGQGLCLAGWLRPRFSFWIFLCDTNKHTHTQNFPSHLLRHYFPPTLSVCGLPVVLVTSLRYERGKGWTQVGGRTVLIEETQGARNRVRRDALGLFPVSNQIILQSTQREDRIHTPTHTIQGRGDETAYSWKSVFLVSSILDWSAHIPSFLICDSISVANTKLHLVWLLTMSLREI